MDKEEANKQLREDTERYRAFKDMVASKGWKYFLALINTKVEERTQKLFDEPSEVSSRKDDYNKGACYGLLFARDVVSHTIAAFDSTSDPATEGDNK